MCGIFGYIGNEDPLKTCLKGLENLEYRGYDSAGIAGLLEGKIQICKEVGKLNNLKEKLTLKRLEIAIGHTRWATHGKVTNINAHPHVDGLDEIALVHNGIIENCDELKSQLEEQGIHFISETDTEVITNLIALYYEGDLLFAVKKALDRIRGSFAIALVHKNHPGQIIAAARGSPLSIGYNDEHTEAMISSDPNAFLGKSLNIIFLRDGEIALTQKEQVKIFDKDLSEITKKAERLAGHYAPPSKEGFEHYLIKEIYEQPQTVQKAIFGRIDGNHVHFESIPESAKQAKSIWLIGCGTSANAGAIGVQMLEDIANISATCELASEARYRIIPKEALIIAISQSGETADTIAAVREIKGKGHTVIAICNVKNSTLVREADGFIDLKAGPEISVCSTKAFTSQIAVLYLLAHFLAGTVDAKEIFKIPSQIEEVLHQIPRIEFIADKYSHYDNFFFMGRRYMLPTCMEAALKLKELSYVNANGYAAGELKHGAIALIDSNFPVIAFCANQMTQEKIMSNIQEVKARGAPVLALLPEDLKTFAKVADDVIWLPKASDPLSPFVSTVAAQLLAYFIAKRRGCDIDHPRNLAKSVTVE